MSKTTTRAGSLRAGDVIVFTRETVETVQIAGIDLQSGKVRLILRKPNGKIRVAEWWQHTEIRTLNPLDE